MALEPSGTLPTVKQLSRKQDMAGYLAETRDTMGSVLGRSFFITREMDRQFRGQVTDGLLLPILEVLVRLHNTILGFRYTRLDDAGKLIDRDLSYKPRTPYGDKGLQIAYRSDEDQSVHQMYYLTINLDDEHLKTNPQFVKYSAGLKGAVTLLKATSYMTHNGRVLHHSRPHPGQQPGGVAGRFRVFRSTSSARIPGRCSYSASTRTPTAASAT